MQFETQASVNNHTASELIEVLYSQTYRIAVGNIVAIALMVVWLFNISNPIELYIWGSIILLLAAIRVIAFHIKKTVDNNFNHKFWLHVWALISLFTGFAYAFGFVYFIPVDEPFYILMTVCFILGLTAATIIGYGASVYCVLCFMVPVILIPTYFIAVNGQETGLIAAIGLALYVTIVYSLLKNVNQTIVKSIVLNFQLKQEVEKRKLVEKQLQDISRRDGLTGLFNRRYFDEMLDVEIGRAHRNHLPLCLIIFDIDCFKEYNDYYGHVAGDNCLITISDIASNLANRKGDLVARYGGEEFAIILPNIDFDGAVAFANKLQIAVQKKRITHETSRLTTLKSVTISVGVTNLMPFSKTKPKELVNLADEALYEAKRQGRNRVFARKNNHLDENSSS